MFEYFEKSEMNTNLRSKHWNLRRILMFVDVDPFELGIRFWPILAYERGVPGSIKLINRQPSSGQRSGQFGRQQKPEQSKMVRIMSYGQSELFKDFPKINQSLQG